MIMMVLNLFIFVPQSGGSCNNCGVNGSYLLELINLEPPLEILKPLVAVAFSIDSKFNFSDIFKIITVRIA